jgi:serine/threonine protein kinase
LELVRTDLEIGWCKRQGMLVEHYEQRFPELKKLGCRVELLRDEYRLRQNHGDRPAIEEYEARFPAEYKEFARHAADLVEVGEPEEIDPSAPTLGAQATQNFGTNDSLETSFALTGRFKKIRKIGSGGFGEVWEAQAPGGVPVAVKRVHGTVSAKSVERERKSLDLICSGQLRHPFLLQVFSWWIHGDRLHIMMELADGSLDDRLKEVKDKGLVGIPRDELKQTMVDAASALDFLNHDRNILHRDVKPANMLLMSGRLKLCDFGLSRMTQNLKLETGKTMGAGTPIFIAPEIIEGYQSMNSDQYSLAATYHMLRTGRPVFRGRVKEIRRQHLEDEPRFEDAILTESEKRALRRALSKVPEERFPTSTEFVAELFKDFDPEATLNAFAVLNPTPVAASDDAVTLMDLKYSATPRVTEVSPPVDPALDEDSGESVIEVPLINLLAGPDAVNHRPASTPPANASEHSLASAGMGKNVPTAPNVGRIVKAPPKAKEDLSGRNWQHLKRATANRGTTRSIEQHAPSVTRRKSTTQNPKIQIVAVFLLGFLAAAILAAIVFSS